MQQLEIRKRRSYLALYLMATFALLVDVLVTWLAPKVITWYFTPPAQYGFTCTAPIEWALSRYRTAQISGLFVGAALGLVVYFLVRRRREPAQITG